MASNSFLLLSFTLSTLLQISSSQTVHQVGGALNWIVPPGGASVYSTWASNQSFKVGDILVFNFDSTRHDVTKVTKTAFDGCNTVNPISKTTTAPANITLNSTGTHYFICSFPGHCAGGQKLAVNVGSGSPSSAPSPSPKSAPTPTQTPSSAPEPSTNTESPATAASPDGGDATTTPSSPSPDGSVATPPSPGNSAMAIGVGLSLSVLAVCVGFVY